MERGIIGCFFHETNSHCDYMQTKKLEAHTVGKLEQWQGYGKYNLTGQDEDIHRLLLHDVLPGTLCKRGLVLSSKCM